MKHDPHTHDGPDMASRMIRDIWLYPIKSLDGLRVEQATVSASGSLAHDRVAVLTDANGQVIRAKDEPKLHRIRCHYQLEQGTVALAFDDGPPSAAWHMHENRALISQWLSEYLQRHIELRNASTALPDDPNVLGPTVVSTGTLQAVCQWFAGLSMTDLTRRLRVNLVYEGPAFDEDQLVADEADGVSMTIGDVQLLGVAPCGRCAVPTRNWRTGQGEAGFIETFIANRQAAHPTLTARPRFKHFYYLTTRTSVCPSQAGKPLRLGDAVTVGSIQIGAAPEKTFSKFAQRATAILDN